MRFNDALDYGGKLDFAVRESEIDPEFFTEWERNFLQDLAWRLPNLTDKQKEIIERIYLKARER